jgi:16S rRNA (cytosine1402-N4)-methyltransferase
MKHVTVLLQETVEGLNPHAGGVYVDGTLGSGGHTALIAKLAPGSTIIGIDADPEAIARATARLAGCGAKLITHLGYNTDLPEVLKQYGIEHVDGVLLDLGISSDQLETAGRGFSFMKDEPLLMTMHDSIDEDTMTAATIVNTFTEEQIATIIYGYGEEQFSRRIAKGIVEFRAKTRITTTAQLRDIIVAAVPAWYRTRKTHPATKTFQALRIAVNDELERLEQMLVHAFVSLVPGGRLSVISFHSLEDRIVKRFMKALVERELAKPITKKPIIPTDVETKENPRARSAKLRILEKK